jgi:DNA polymerase III sliding clamp (beta) subunit (PCNA family)
MVTYHDEHEIMVGAGICELIDGKFPDIERIIPKQTAPAEQIGFNAKYLADVEKLAKLFNPKYESVRFELNGNTNAAVANVNAPTGETAKVIVMPMRI